MEKAESSQINIARLRTEIEKLLQNIRELERTVADINRVTHEMNNDTTVRYHEEAAVYKQALRKWTLKKNEELLQVRQKQIEDGKKKVEQLRNQLKIEESIAASKIARDKK